MYLDPMYFVFLAPAILLSLWASFRTKWAFNKYSQVRAASGITGAEAAHRMLAQAGITDVEIVPTHGMLSDHYNPVTKKLALSEPVYATNSIAAIGVACHEAGHAIQHARAYKPLWLRSALVPTAKIGSSLGWIVMVIGLMMMTQSANPATGQTVVLAGAVLFSAVLAFQVASSARLKPTPAPQMVKASSAVSAVPLAQISVPAAEKSAGVMVEVPSSKV